LPSTVLEAKLEDLGIDPYLNFNHSIENKTTLDLEKLREVQNLLWAETALDKAHTLMN